MAKTNHLDPERAFKFCRAQWDDDLQNRLSDFIKIPAISPAYDHDWEEHGLLDKVASDLAQWLKTLPISGLTVEILREQGRTPLVFVDIPGTADATGTVLFYGHLDKQPGGNGWVEGTGPWQPVFDGTRLFGRGGADDGYAPYAAMAAVMAVDDQELPRPRCIGFFETSEESGSPDVGHWLKVLQPCIGKVDLVVCLDSGAGDYERLWLVTSLRGHTGGRLEIQVLAEGAHSGDAGGIVPSSFRVLRQLLDRLEDSSTGQVLLKTANANIPAERVAQAQEAGAILGDEVLSRFSWFGTAEDRVEPTIEDPAELLLNRAWRPSLSITGADGLPPISNAGGVLRPSTALKLSLRLPPTVDSTEVGSEIRAVLEASPPYNASVRFIPDSTSMDGWNARTMEPWLHDVLNQASRDFFDGAGLAMIGQGGTIPLMAVLDRHFPDAAVLACGVQGPGTNAHGPNESLHMPYTHRLTASLAAVLPAVAMRSSEARSAFADSAAGHV